MLDLLIHWDEALFRWVNDAWSCRPLDVMFCLATNPRNWIVFIVPAVVWLVTRGGVKGRFVVLALVMSVCISDPFGARILKPFFHRTRPCNFLADVRTPCGRSDAPSFPSIHAMNMGASMTVLSLAYPPATPTFAGIALLVGTSRVYLGLHFPSDILGGYLMGMLIGIGSWRLVDRWRWKWVARKPPAPTARKRGK